MSKISAKCSIRSQNSKTNVKSRQLWVRHCLICLNGSTATDDGVPEDNKHLLTVCPATARLRREIFGRDHPTLAEVFADPYAVVAFLKRLGHLRRPRYGHCPSPELNNNTLFC